MRPLEIFLASPRGFCGGVARAIKIVEKALDKFGAPVYVLHEIVHNKRVLADLSQKGAVFVKKLEQIPAGAVAIFSAHGVAEKVETEAKAGQLQAVDATCPLVKKVHVRAMQFEEQGKQVIIIGNEGHPEIVGTSGRLKQTPILISSAEEAEQLEVSDPNNLAVVSQTTLNSDYTAHIIDILKQRFPTIAGTDASDICYATKTRQGAVKDLIKDHKVEALIVIGSKNSSNSNKLRDLGTKAGLPSFLIDGHESLTDGRDGVDLAALQGVSRLAITAGASAPEIVVQEVVSFLSKHRQVQVHDDAAGAGSANDLL